MSTKASTMELLNNTQVQGWKLQESLSKWSDLGYVFSLALPFVEIEAKKAHRRSGKPYDSYPETLSSFTVHAIEALMCYAGRPKRGVSPLAAMRSRLKMDGGRLCNPPKRKTDPMFNTDALESHYKPEKGFDVIDFRDTIAAASERMEYGNYRERLFLRAMLRDKSHQAANPKSIPCVRKIAEAHMIPRDRGRDLWNQFKEHLLRIIRSEEQGI